MEIKSDPTAAVIEIDMGGDMSAARRSAGYFIGGEVSSLMLEASWPATGSPVGAFKLETFSRPSATSGKPHDAFLLPAVVAGQPSGGAGSLTVDRMRTSSAYVCVSYAPTSGGTGAIPTITLSLKRS